MPSELIVDVDLKYNPYTYMLNDKQLGELLLGAAEHRASSIQQNFGNEDGPLGAYPRNSMGFAIVNPVIRPWTPVEEYLLAVIAVGPEGSEFMVNAASKALSHYYVQRNWGEVVNIDPHLAGDGDFRWGHSAEVRGVVGGGSGQNANQDQYEAAQLLTDVVNELCAAHQGYLRSGAEVPNWLSGNGKPNPFIEKLVGAPSLGHATNAAAKLQQ